MLVTRPNVELARVGSWSASTGPWNCTKSQLADAVRAYESGHFRAPVLKRGHTDDRFAGDIQATGDGEPSLGVVKNLRLANGGDSLIGDLLVPDWLDEELPAVYPSRSIEADIGVETSSGERFDLVMTGLALLGVTKPAIQSLAEIPEAAPEPMQYLAAMSLAASIPLEAKWNVVFDESKHKRQGGRFVSKGSGYSAKKDQSPQVRALQKELVRLGFLDPKSGKNGGIDGLFGPATEAAVKAWQRQSGNMATGRVTPALLSTLKDAKKGTNPAKFSAQRKAERRKSKAADTKRRVVDAIARRAKVKAAADEHVEDLNLTVREVLTEDVVYQDADDMSWVADVDETDDGGVEIGELAPVTVTYTPLAASDASLAAHKMRQSEITSPRGWDLPSGSSLGATRVDITPQMREALGVDEQADEAAILAALEKLKSAKDAPPVETPKDSKPVDKPANSSAQESRSDRPEAQTEQREPEKVTASGDLEARLTAKFEAQLKASVGTLEQTNKTLADELAKVTGELATRKADEAVTKRETLLASAVQQGKITPADKEHYGAIYDTSPEAAEKLLASRAPGSAVPLSAIGHSSDVQQDDEFKSLMDAWNAGVGNG